MKPSERIEQIRKELVNNDPSSVSYGKIIEALLQFLDEEFLKK